MDRNFFQKVITDHYCDDDQYQKPDWARDQLSKLIASNSFCRDFKTPKQLGGEVVSIRIEPSELNTILAWLDKNCEKWDGCVRSTQGKYAIEDKRYYLRQSREWASEEWDSKDFHILFYQNTAATFFKLKWVGNNAKISDNISIR